jgi:hypothetical protein
MDGVGTFSRKMTYIGSLIGANIGNAHYFSTVDTHTQLYNRYVAYTGNRVNIYVMDQISTASRSPILTPGLKLGISVHWCFQAKINDGGNQNCFFRQEDWNGSNPIASTVLNPVSPMRVTSSETEYFGENKIEFGGYIPVSLGNEGLSPRPFATAELSPVAYTFPWSTEFSGESGSRNYCIPVVARADFMIVSFWCEPITWHGSLATDQIHIWALSGTDVAGSQKI